MSSIVIDILIGVIGCILSSLMACVPALHVYNLAGFAILFSEVLEKFMMPHQILIFMMGLVVGYSILNTIPSIFLGAPDESCVFIVLPSLKYMMEGKGFEGTILTGIGGLLGVSFLVLILPLFSNLVGNIKTLLSPHMYWILSLIIVYMMMSEWPKGGYRGNRLQKFLDAWSSLFAGMATFLLSGIMGFIIMNKSLTPIKTSFQGIMPAFVGLFAVPWIITNFISKTEIPKQFVSDSVDISPNLLLKGMGSGAFGGMFAAFFPIVTGGIGGLLAGHATAQRDNRLFILSQGVSKVVYYVGAFLLLYLPTVHLSRGGMAAMVKSIHTPYTIADFYGALGIVAISGGIAFLLMIPITKWMIKLIEKIDYRVISKYTLLVVILIVWSMTGWQGLLIMSVSTCIGFIPVMFYSRKMNCMGVLLLPVTLNMAGLGPKIVEFMGLIK
jgi:putative membrane protein